MISIIKWLTRVHQWQEIHSGGRMADVFQIAQFHFDFEHIHPFVDGNGRTGRALVWYMLRYAGIEPFVFTSNDRVVYYEACRDAEKMTGYFERGVGPIPI